MEVTNNDNLIYNDKIRESRNNNEKSDSRDHANNSQKDIPQYTCSMFILRASMIMKILEGFTQSN